jgi:hypothetical protein
MADTTSNPAYQWPNWLNLLLAIWLFISPWAIGFASGAGGAEAVTLPNAGAAAWNAWVIAVIVAALSLAAIAKLAVWEDWVNLVLGVWLFFSPWILGYAALGGAMWNSLVVGFLIGLLAIWGIAAARSVSVRA